MPADSKIDTEPTLFDGKYEVRAEQLDADEYMREKGIPFYYDASHDYEQDVNQFCPAYELPQVRESPLKPGAAFSDERGTREVRIGSGRQTATMPFMRYIRMVDPQGNVCQVSISTTRPSPTPEGRNGYDGLGTEARVKSEKLRKGWLPLDANEYMNGRTGQEMVAWSLAVAEKRRLAHNAYEAKEYPDRTKQAIDAQIAVQSKLMEGVAAPLAKAVIAGVQAAQATNAKPARQAKGGEQ